MKIIGHRGAAGLALENSLESIRTAIQVGVDAIEIDIRLTRDGQLVISHDPNTARVSPANKPIHHTSLKDLRSIKLHNGERLPTLQEVLRVVGNTPLIIEGKSGGWAKPLTEVLGKRHKDISVIAFDHDELSRFRLLRPDIPTYALDRWSPFEIIQIARRKQFTGIDLNFWVMNPLTYWLAQRAHLEIILFTIDRPWLAKLLKLLYPKIILTTNRPDKLQSLRRSG